ncbi:MAG: hypothetical protein H0W48_09080 [Methylibium sp.]|nr:hypothetical protein [Methylibium sp.]
MKVTHLNLGVPIRVRTVCTTVAPSATTASAARAAQQRAKLEELRAYVAAEDWESGGAQPSRPPPAATGKSGGAEFHSSQPAPVTPAEFSARVQARMELLAKQSQERFSAAMQNVRERYRNSGMPRPSTSDIREEMSHG